MLFNGGDSVSDAKESNYVRGSRPYSSLKGVGEPMARDQHIRLTFPATAYIVGLRHRVLPRTHCVDTASGAPPCIMKGRGVLVQQYRLVRLS